MRLSQRFGRQSARRRSNLHRCTRCVIDLLESRQLFDGETVTASIPPILASTTNPSSNSVTLNQFFTDSLLPGTLVTFSTTEGTIDVALTDKATPLTVANFLSYVDSGAYNGTIFHRSVDLNTNLGGSPTAPATIIQGGGYSISSNTSGSSINHIPTNSPVQDEYSTAVLNNSAGTLAMAKTSSANSATSEFYFNVTANPALDVPTQDPSTGAATSYTVFGTVLSGTQVVDNIAALPTTSALGGGLDTVPVTGLNEAQISAGATVSPQNLIFTNSVTAQPGTSYTVTSDNKALVTPTVTNGVLSFSYGTGGGTADITVVAKNLDGTSATTTFAVTVPDPTTPGAGPVAAPVSPPFVVTGSNQSFGVLAQATDSKAPLLPSSVAIVAQPAHGTATVDPSTGFINYAPTSGYTGSDTLTFTVSDTLGNVSAPQTATLTVAPTAVTVTIGGALSNPKALVFTEPDGVVGHMSITGTGATATVTFTDYRVTVTNKAGVAYATGAGVDIARLTTNNTGQNVVFTLTSNGPVTIGSVAANACTVFNAPDVTLTGECTFFALGRMNIAALNNADLFTGVRFLPQLIINSVTNSSVTANFQGGTIGNIGLIKSKQWINTNGGTYNISAGSIDSLQVPGTFDENLALTSTNYSLFSANVGTATGNWGMDGSIFKLAMQTPGTKWALNSNGLVRSLTIHGNLSNNQITAAAITTMTVSGTTDGAVVETDATFSPKFNQIQKLVFGGAVTNTVVFSAGNIGSISAPSFTGGRIYAGVDITLAKNGQVPTNASNLSNDAKITSFSLGRGANAFANSEISADILSSLQLGKIATSNSGTVEGVFAHTIGSMSGTLVPGGVLRPTKTDLKSAAAFAAYVAKKKLALGDFDVGLF
jgi:peptidyl-prolyl cis-trans isomerase A (cyclophilin A)